MLKNFDGRVVAMKLLKVSVLCCFVAKCLCSFDGNCSFSSVCNCDGDNVVCLDCFRFPKFTDSSYVISTLFINGNYSYISANALYPLQGLLSTAKIYIEGSKSDIAAGLSTPFVMDNTALHTYNNIGFSNLYFSYFNMSVGFSNVAFANVSIPYLYFSNNEMVVLDDYAFNLLHTNSITIENCNTSWVDPAAFSGLSFGVETSYLSLAENKLNNLYIGFKDLHVHKINLERNLISLIDDFTFCACNVIGKCSNNYLHSLQVGYNPITDITENAFANLPNLINLSLIQADLTAIPVSALSTVAPSVIQLDLSFNKITNIDVNSFLKYASMITISFDYNPIAEIVPGAFNGVSAMKVLQLSNLHNLQTADALISYGMDSVVALNLENCSVLHSLGLIDYLKLPPSLILIDLSNGNDIREISSEFQHWLTSVQSAFINISNNKNFDCERDIQWMAKFSLCQPIQIQIQNSFCYGTKTSLADYLAHFNPICD